MKTDLNFAEISEKIRNFNFPDVDCIVGIGSGGIVPASIVAFHLEKPLLIISINYRDDNNDPRYEDAAVLSVKNIPAEYKKILLVDDVSVSGRTLEAAKKIYSEKIINTFVLKGKADFVLYQDITTCVNWPWK